VWLELVLAAQDLLCWAQVLLLDGDLKVAEPKTLRYRLLAIEAFNALLEAQVLVEDWRIEDLARRPQCRATFRISVRLAVLHSFILVSGDSSSLGAGLAGIHYVAEHPK
jgi:hypothetical protein